MKRQKILLLVILSVLIGSVALGIAASGDKPEGKPFQAIWDAIDDLQYQTTAKGNGRLLFSWLSNHSISDGFSSTGAFSIIANVGYWPVQIYVGQPTTNFRAKVLSQGTGQIRFKIGEDTSTIVSISNGSYAWTPELILTTEVPVSGWVDFAIEAKGSTLIGGVVVYAD